MKYNRCGNSGLLLPALSLGLWHNFGGVDVFENGRAIVRSAYENGITHFDLANNYGPPPGSAEENFGMILKKDFPGFLRDHLVISTKAGYRMWDGPYGEWGSRKYLLSSLDQSLKRLQIDYVDIFYSHRPDPDTPMEETMSALDYAVRSGRALYAGISNYNAEQASRAIAILEQLGTPCIIHQPKYSMFERTAEAGLLELLGNKGVGCIPYSPLAQGLLTNRYLNGIPADSRAGKEHGYLQTGDITEEKLMKIRSLHPIARERGQSLSQMAIAWLMRNKVITSVLIGVSSVAQLEDNLRVMDKAEFSEGELRRVEEVLV
jgi:L-glyceraldehyde 3-phosphate reductase